MITILCPECQRPIEFDSDPKIGQQTTCQSCAREWVVTWLYPISLDSLDVSEQVEMDKEPNAHLPRQMDAAGWNSLDGGDEHRLSRVVE